MNLSIYIYLSISEEFEIKTGLRQGSAQISVYFDNRTYFKKKYRRGTHEQDHVCGRSGDNSKRRR